MHVASLGRVDLIPSTVFDDYKRAVEERDPEAVAAFWGLCRACEEGNAAFHANEPAKYNKESMVEQSSKCSFERTYAQEWEDGGEEVPRDVPAAPRGRTSIANKVVPGKSKKDPELPYRSGCKYQVTEVDCKGSVKEVTYTHWPYHIKETRYPDDAPIPTGTLLPADNVWPRLRPPIPSSEGTGAAAGPPTLRPTKSGCSTPFTSMSPAVMTTLRGEYTHVMNKEGVTIRKWTHTAGRLLLAPRQQGKKKSETTNYPWKEKTLKRTKLDIGPSGGTPTFSRAKTGQSPVMIEVDAHPAAGEEDAPATQTASDKEPASPPPSASEKEPASPPPSTSREEYMEDLPKLLADMVRYGLTEYEHQYDPPRLKEGDGKSVAHFIKNGEPLMSFLFDKIMIDLQAAKQS